MDRDPDLLIAAQPTRGLDVGAIEFIHRRLIEQRDHGKAVLLVSFELDEIMNLSDRIAVIYEGAIIDIVDPKQTTEQELGLLMAGSKKKGKVNKPMSNRTLNLLIPVVSVILGLLAGALIMLVSGYNPVDGYIALWNGAFGQAFYVGETLRLATPYIFAGLAIAFAFRTGLFNIGAEGQLIVGWIAAVWVGVAFDLPKVIHLPLAILAACCAGAFGDSFPAF